jgi:hypothetical protein
VDGKVPSPLVHISIDDLVPSCTLSLYIRVVCTPDEASRKLTRVRSPYVKPRWARTRPERRPRGRRRLSAPDSATTTACDGRARPLGGTRRTSSLPVRPAVRFMRWSDRRQAGSSAMFSNRIIEPYRKGTDKMINRDKSSISPINRG